MSLYRHPKSAYWWVRFTIGGQEVRQSTGTKERKQAEEYEHDLRGRYWRAVRLGQEHHTWKEARERWVRERATKRSLERDERIFAEYAELDAVALRDITRETLAELRVGREGSVSIATANREFALIRAVLARAAMDWGWLEHAPNVPMTKLDLPDPRWVSRPQFERLLAKLPAHAADMARLAVATGLRRGNITGMTWDRVDLENGFAYVPGSQAKGKRGIPVPLNSEAIAVLARWQALHEARRHMEPSRQWSEETHRYVFVFRGIAPIAQLATRAWREACKSVGLAGLRFHDLRHTWASWQAQAGTPAYAIRELGGWSSDAMVKRYAHLGAGDLKAYADRTLVGTKVGTPAKKRRAAHK